jgi:hypothetical protein
MWLRSRCDSLVRLGVNLPRRRGPEGHRDHPRAAGGGSRRGRGCSCAQGST